MLAKPFTKDGMVRILKKHLAYMLQNPPQPEQNQYDMGQNGGMPGPTGPAQSYASMLGSGSTVKFEGGTPSQSPATSASWHSPSQAQMSHASPNLDNSGYVGGRPQMVLTPTGLQQPGFPPQIGTPPIPRMGDGMGGDDRPEKRQRLYGPGPGQGY